MKSAKTVAAADDRRIPMLGRPFVWIIALVIAAFAVAPLIGDNVELRESLLLATVYITLASNLNIMLGYAGYINFGSIVFFGLGGYICVYLINAQGWSLAAGELAAGVAVSLLALIFGLGILRLRGAFFALATIGINEGVQAFVSISNRGAAPRASICRRRYSRSSAGRCARCGSCISCWSRSWGPRFT